MADVVDDWRPARPCRPPQDARGPQGTEENSPRGRTQRRRASSCVAGLFRRDDPPCGGRSHPFPAARGQPGGEARLLRRLLEPRDRTRGRNDGGDGATPISELHHPVVLVDRKSTRLNSSHVAISYAVFCLKKKKKENSVSVEMLRARSSPGISYRPIAQSILADAGLASLNGRNITSTCIPSVMSTHATSSV